MTDVGGLLPVRLPAGMGRFLARTPTWAGTIHWYSVTGPCVTCGSERGHRGKGACDPARDASTFHGQLSGHNACLSRDWGSMWYPILWPPSLQRR